MDKHSMPPSYNEVYPPSAPSAPLMGVSPSHNPQPQPATNPSWNPGMNQYPQYPVTAQPVYQPQVVQHQVPQQQTVVIINQQWHLGDNPVTMMCPHCHQQTITKISHDTGFMTHLAAGVLCLIGCWPCCCIPYCVDCLKNVTHKCGKCHGYIGTYNRATRRY